MGADQALATLAQALLKCWHSGGRLVVLGNMLGPNGDPVRTLDWLLALRRRLLSAPGARTCDLVFLRGAQEEMWHKALRLQFALTPLQIFDRMLERGLAAVVEAYGLSIAEGRGACRNGPSMISRWTGTLRSRQAAYGGHADLLNALSRAARNARGTILLSAAGAAPVRALDSQADAFW
jgi:serine/threonine protein phosphatase 1